MALKIKTYEDQAKLSVMLAVVGAVFVVGAMAGMIRNFDASTVWVRYSTRSIFMPALGACLLAALGLSTIGFFVGLNSAGQRLNKRPRLAWAGFFLNAAVITLALSAGVFFVVTRHAVR